ncbi:MAG: PAS domain S-box protein [Cyanobacteria bacterium P01_G01_bin.54]
MVKNRTQSSSSRLTEVEHLHQQLDAYRNRCQALEQQLQQQARCLNSPFPSANWESVLNSLFAYAPVGIAIFDQEGRYIHLNSLVAEFNGLPVAAHLGKTALEIFPHYGEQILKICQQVLNTQAPVVNCEIHCPSNEPEHCYWLANYFPMLDGQGQAVGICLMLIDISDRKQAEVALQAQTEFLQSIYNGTNQALFVVDVTSPAEFHYRGCNTVAQRWTGKTEAQVQGLTPSAAFGPEMGMVLQEHYTACIAQGTAMTQEQFMVFNGFGRWVLSTLSPLHKANGEIERLIVTCCDITMNKQAEIERQKLASIVEHSQDLACIASLTGHCRYLNQAGFTLTGLDRTTDLTTLRLQDFLLPAETERFSQTILPHVLTHGHWQGQLSLRHWQTGEVILTHYQLSRLSDRDAGEAWLSAIATDITAVHEVEFKRQQMVSLVENSPDLIGITTLTGQPIYLNSAGLELVGLADNTAAQQSHLLDFYVPNDRACIETVVLPHVFDTGSWQGEVQFQNVQTGDLIPVEQHIFLLKDAQTGQPTHLATVTRDLTERQAAQSALQESEERYNLAVSGINDGVWDWDLRTDTVYYSPVWMEILGYGTDPLPHTIDTWSSTTHPDDLGNCYAAVEAYLSGESPTYRVTYRAQHRQGHWLWIEARGQCLRDPQGEPYRFIGTITDISERRQGELLLEQKNQDLEATLSELKQTQSQLVQSEKMSGLGQLVAGVAHEINNPVSFIHGNLEHLRGYVQDLTEIVTGYCQAYPQPVPAVQDLIEARELDFLLDDLPKTVTSMMEGSRRISEIVASLRTFSRHDEAEYKTIDLHTGIDSTIMILQNRLKASARRPAIELVRNYGEIPKVECFAGQLNQVMMNILSNAIDALDEVNGQRSYAKNQAQPSRIVITTAHLTASDEVTITIEDNGPGIPETVQPQIFDPFFTTKGIGKGTGLGMSISYQIITEKHQGTIRFRSSPNQGTSFYITIPVCQNIPELLSA